MVYSLRAADSIHFPDVHIARLFQDLGDTPGEALSSLIVLY